MASSVFYGERLREAREARGYSLLQVAEHLGVSKQAVSAYEKSRIQPKAEYFQKLVEFLHVPGHYFAQAALQLHTSPTFYRSLSSATKKMRDVAEQKLKWLREIVRFFEEYIELVPVSLPACHLPSDPNKITTADIEASATDLRRFWGLGDGIISNVVHLLENKGVVVARFPLESDKLDAFSMIEDHSQRPYIVLASDKDNFFRSRHDAAHELGHIILHRNVPAQVLRDSATFKNMEKQAHRFASAFLLPSATFGNELLVPDLGVFKGIKMKWKSSIAAMIMRAADLGILSSTQKERLMAKSGRNGWKLEEPFDRDVQPELPMFFSKSCEMIVNEAIMSRVDILWHLAKDKVDVETILGLCGFFDERKDARADEPSPILKFHSSAG